MAINADISAPKGPQIEEIKEPAPTLQTIIAALASFKRGKTVSNAKLSEMTGIPKDALQGFLNELAERGVIIDRGGVVEVI